VFLLQAPSTCWFSSPCAARHRPEIREAPDLPTGVSYCGTNCDHSPSKLPFVTTKLKHLEPQVDRGSIAQVMSWLALVPPMRFPSDLPSMGPSTESLRPAHSDGNHNVAATAILWFKLHALPVV